MKLQNGLKERGFDIGKTDSVVTPVYMKGDVPEATAMVMDLRENYGIFCINSSVSCYPERAYYLPAYPFCCSY